MSPFLDLRLAPSGSVVISSFSRKPSPALLAVDTWDADAVEQDLIQTLEACDRYGCPVELILKDISTVRHKPERLWEWARIARDLVQSAVAA